MLIAILLIGWLAGAVSTIVAVTGADPGILGALAIFAGSGVAASLLAGLVFAFRPCPRAKSRPQALQPDIAS